MCGVSEYMVFLVLNPFFAQTNYFDQLSGPYCDFQGAKNVKFWLKPGENIFFHQVVCVGCLNICFLGCWIHFWHKKLFWPTFRAVLWVPGEPKRSNLGFNMVKILFSPNCIVRCLNILNYQNIHLFHIKLGWYSSNCLLKCHFDIIFRFNMQIHTILMCITWW